MHSQQPDPTADMHGQQADALAAMQPALLAAQDELVDRLARVAEARGRPTGQHPARVGATSALLGRAVGLEDAAAAALGRAAQLYDVGTIGLPDAILCKPVALTPDEMAVVQGHTTAGAALLADSAQAVVRLAETIALTHHERWDGAGYPQGLVGEAIPLSGRIVAVADAFDALTHDRPYRAARPIGEALAVLGAQAGRQFDPQVVAALLALHDRGDLGAAEPAPPE